MFKVFGVISKRRNSNKLESVCVTCKKFKECPERSRGCQCTLYERKGKNDTEEIYKNDEGLVQS